MNPETSIRPWLLAVGKQFGINQAHEYQWNDASTRPQEMYFTFEIIASTPDQDGAQKTKTKTDHTAHVKYWQRWITTVQIDVFRSQNGMAELAALVIAAENFRSVQNLFEKSGCSFFQVPDKAENMTVIDADSRREDLHHQIIVEFYDHPSVSLSEVNAVVDDFLITFNDWD